MQIGGIKFPQAVLDAQRAGNLVIFAGAGVSIPSPSNYPNFDSLADKLSLGSCSRDKEKNEPVDHFLGRLVHRGVDVHTRVRDLLSDPTSAPNGLHFDLLRLFPSCSHIRLVTTNFDLHFSTAASDIFKQCVPEFYSAPALPVGDDFSGIVYLHGSVDKPASRMVLTDSDFGRAYLTDGWARRFLQGVFGRYVVLFVGYSYSDAVMNYLTRGLPPDSGQVRRFAFAKAGQGEYWGYLGIEPLEYEVVDVAENKHERLAQAISQWTGLANTGVLEHEAKIKQIVEGPVPLGTEEQDYIENCLSEISYARFFVRYAVGLDWLRWAEDKKAFQRIFRSDVVLNEIDEQLARWFAREFVCKHSDDALALLRRKGQSITPLLWATIALAFHTEKPPSKVAQKWVPLLVRYPTPRMGRDLLEYTLHRSQFPEDLNSALLLFEYLTKPDVILERSWWRDEQGASDASVDVKLQAEGDDPWLSGAWAGIFKPNIDRVGNRLIWILTSNLQRAHLLLEAYDKVHATWDSFSSRRGMIESTAQGSPEKGLGKLIDASRDLLEWYLEHEHHTADELIDLWFSSGINVLKRLAIFGVSKATHWSGDEKIEWVLQKDLLYAPSIKHELFLVLEGAYSNASSELREKLLDRAAGGPRLAADHPDVQAYEEYNLLYWLSSNAPQCAPTKARFEAIRAKHPEFGPRDHPDMDAWIGPVTSGWESPVTYQEILSKPPGERLDYIVHFVPKDAFREPSRAGLLQQFTAAISHDFDWGFRFAALLAQNHEWKKDVWESLIVGWKTSIENTRWRSVLSFLLDNEKTISVATHQIADLLNDGVEKVDHAIPDAYLDDAIAVGTLCLRACIQDERHKSDESDDWLFLALNSPPGALTLFFLKVLSRTRKRDGYTEIPSNYKETFEWIISGRTYPAELGRVILASQVLFLFGVDERWTVENVIPLFKWSANPRGALQAWDGYLVWGQWSDPLLVHMLANYEAVFPVLHEHFGQHRSAFCSHLAGIAVLSSVDPVRQGWLGRFLALAHIEERNMWTAAVGGTLQQTTEESKASVWERWMKKYWFDRTQGVPVPLTGSEAGAMASWALHLEPVFSEAVVVAQAGPLPEIRHDHIYYEIENSEIPNRYPDDVAKFVLYLLRGPHDGFWACDNVGSIVTVALSGGCPAHNLLLICDELARLGCGNAGSLRTAILNR